tara:strand:- start:51 stop:470 length:420 start_codon:yes stop_codon:yes gene_type:complete
MKLTKATLKKMIKEELSSTRKRPVRRRRRRSLREAREGVTDDRGYKNFGPMEKKLFDRIEQAIGHMREIDQLWFENIYDDPNYNDPNGQMTVPSEVLKRIGGLLEDINIAIGGAPESERGSAETLYPGNNYDDDTKYFG